MSASRNAEVRNSRPRSPCLGAGRFKMALGKSAAFFTMALGKSATLMSGLDKTELIMGSSTTNHEYPFF